jgi:hypothetical protein
LHCDLTAANGLLAALLYKNGKTGSPYAATISWAMQKAGVYYRLADVLEEKDGR